MKKFLLCNHAEYSNIPYRQCSKGNGCKSTKDYSMVTQNLRELIIKYEPVSMNSGFSVDIPFRFKMEI